MEDKKINPDTLKKLLEKQHYEFAGEHTAVKICEWAKKSLRDEGVCYKEKFYGIKSHLCCQMSPTINFCNHECVFCWRPQEHNLGTSLNNLDNPKDIIENSIKAQRKKLNGFWGNEKANKKKLEEAQNPKGFAISLSGEPTLFAKLPELIDELKKRNMTSFLVTNGTNPKMIKKLIDHQPTQLYVTLPAPNEDIYEKTSKPLVKGLWNKIMTTLSLLNKFKRSCIRLTLVKGLNMVEPKKYAEIIEKANPLFVEVKAYMHVGYSKQRLERENMPRHEEIIEFAKEICKYADLKIIDEQKPSRVVLLMKEDIPDRIMKF